MQPVASPLLKGLNPEQSAAVLSEEKRLLVLAGAGAGKAKTLIQRIVHPIFVKNVKPSSSLAITFTRNAANEMVATQAFFRELCSQQGFGQTIQQRHE